MFWLQRMKAERQETSWALPYGDLMSLLLSIFVMIAAMSELVPGGRFETVRQGVRKAFGLSAGVSEAKTPVSLPEPMTFLDRLEREGMQLVAGQARQELNTAGLHWELLATGDCTLFRLPMKEMANDAGEVTPAGRELAAQLASALRTGRNDLEVRCRLRGAESGAAAGADEAWRRCRVLADELIREGVSRGRIRLTVSELPASGEANDPASPPTDDGACIDVLVHAGLLDEWTN